MGWLSAEEERVLRFAAERFDRNEPDFQVSEVYDEIGLDQERVAICMRRPENFGAVKIAAVLDRGDVLVRAMPHAVDMVRELDQRTEEQRTARPDLVKQIKATLRQNPWTACPIIVVLGLGALIAIINQAWELVAKIVAAFGH